MSKLTIILLTLSLCGYANKQFDGNVSGHSFSSKLDSNHQLEIIHIDSILINNKLGFLTTPSELIEQFDKPDKIESRVVECGGYFTEDEVLSYKYGKSTFTVNKETAVLEIINFLDGRFTLKTTKMTLDRNTTLSEFGAVYPVAVKQSYELTDDKDKKTYRIVRVTPKADWDDQWVLRFYNGNLIDIEYWIPC